MKAFEYSPSFAAQMDLEDPLRTFQSSFLIPKQEGRDRVYFLGNSLGLQPVNTRAAVDRVLRQWQDEGVESFFKGEMPWLDMHQRLQHAMAPIAGARPAELSIMNQLTVNIHLMLVSFYRPEGKRKKILMESKAFPSDQYALRSYLEHLGMDPDEVIIELKASDHTEVFSDEDIISAIHAHGDELALVFWGGLNYYTGQVFNMKDITAHAHAVGAKAGFDLAHAIGNVPLSLHDWAVDFACWCSYKYLNGGPGAVAGVYIHEQYLHEEGIKRLSGWWGYKKEDRFLMKSRFLPADDASAWQLSTPSMMSYACLLASLDVFAAAGWHNILEKQAILIAWMEFLLSKTEARGFQCITPASRGCQVSMLFSERGREVYEQLFERGFMVDWREPNVIRMAPVPLYNSYSQVFAFFSNLQDILKSLHL